MLNIRMALPPSTKICFRWASFLIFPHLINPSSSTTESRARKLCVGSVNVLGMCITRAARVLCVVNSPVLDLMVGCSWGKKMMGGHWVKKAFKFMIHVVKGRKGKNLKREEEVRGWPNSPEPTNVPILQIFIFQFMEVAPFWAEKKGKTWKRF